jgi:hypothetical protein
MHGRGEQLFIKRLKSDQFKREQKSNPFLEYLEIVAQKKRSIQT